MNLGIGLGVTNYLRVPTAPLEDPDAAIAALFSSGEVGAWYDPSDSSTVWQDAAGTTPAGVGDPVGRIDDKSGNGNHATQTTSSARPVLQQSGDLYYLDFDGVDDYLIHTFAHAGDTSTIAAAERSGGNTMQGLFFCTPSITKLTGGVWALSVNPNWGSYELGTTWMDTGESLLNTPAVIANISVDSPSSQSLYTNGTLSLAGTGAFYAGDGKERLVVGRETDLGRYFNGNLFGVISIDRAITSGELADVNAYLATKSGVTLSAGDGGGDGDVPLDGGK